MRGGWKRGYSTDRGDALTQFWGNATMMNESALLWGLVLRYGAVKRFEWEGESAGCFEKGILNGVAPHDIYGSFRHNSCAR